MEKLKEKYEIVDFFNGDKTGIIVSSIEEGYDIVRDLEQQSTKRYIPLLIEETNETETPIY